jgi:pimeloyl-ACP methyl ester carboxylesterase
MRRLLVCSLLILFGLGTVLSAQDDDFFFFPTSESAWTTDLDEFWERVKEQRYRHVATLASHSFGGETLLSIDVAYPVVVGQLLLLENRDHPHREVHQVLYVLDDNLILKTRLSADFLRGSRLYQLDGSITR